jgi:RND family efflux transporter MFP subunit
MNRHFPHCADAVRKASAPCLRRLSATLTAALLAAPLSACDDRSAVSLKRATFVRTEIVQPRDRQTSVTLTGEVQARFHADLSFRVSGHVIERLADVGTHVAAGQVLARIDPKEQQAELDAATAAVAASESQLLVAKATFMRQNDLLSKGFTTRPAFDRAQEGLRNAEGVLEAAKAQLGIAKDVLGYTELRADAAGVITARNLEVGQVVQAAQPVFTLERDGDRDAVFDVHEAMFFRDPEDDSARRSITRPLTRNERQVALVLVSNREVTATGYVREISPAVDPKSATVRVKVAIENPPTAMTLGSAVAGTTKWKSAREIILPWTALTAIGSTPAVWVVDPASKTASLKPVAIDRYESGAIAIETGLEPGERVVVDGGKLLSIGQSVTYDKDPP